jgi:hypothetical protein
VRVLLLVGIGIDELLGCLVFSGVGARTPDGPETDEFLEPGLELLLLLVLE